MLFVQPTRYFRPLRLCELLIGDSKRRAAGCNSIQLQAAYEPLFFLKNYLSPTRRPSVTLRVSATFSQPSQSTSRKAPDPETSWYRVPL